MNNLITSPFHKGEQKIQSMLGVRDKMERFGRQVIRDFMPDQHQNFYSQLAFVLIGHADHSGWPWASMLFNKPGFICSPNERLLRMNTTAVSGDPLGESLTDDLRLGVLGIELETRRRNRLSGRVVAHSNGNIDLAIDQAFGNCPQYIQTRKLEILDQKQLPIATVKVITQLDVDAVSLVQNCDTFFVASYVTGNNYGANEGVDVSHRGGKPGFIRVDDACTLTIPDYLGNNHFNTLGNFLENPRAGLLFVDFEHGHLLTLTGTVEILWDSPDTEFFTGAQRLWTFKIEKGRWLKHALPLRWHFQDYSINTNLTGTWEEAAAIGKAEAEQNRWQPYRVVELVNESSVVKSFWLEPKQGHKPKFKAGQFLTVATEVDNKPVIRTYTISSAPTDDRFRISVKHEIATVSGQPNGVFSSYLHEHINVGDKLQVKAPTGAFTLDTCSPRPAVLISAGIGITPMIAMAREALYEGIRTRSMKPLTLICAASNASQRSFFTELNELAVSASGAIRCYWILSQVEDKLELGVDYHLQGRITREFVQSVLPTGDHDAYLCGPPGFMQSVYDLLQELGIKDDRIFAEAFGPASLQRNRQTSTKIELLPVAKQALVRFSNSQVEQHWTPEQGTLLELAEAHGLNPQYGCRSGQCGACKVKLLSGRVSYLYDVEVPLEIDETLTCCTVPASENGSDMVEVELGL
jgi:ferredoxin-NADP reductase/predicted pyridoxine 5'-phosphate oxidase superfamily flavin-nucleotide-binding protein